MDIRNMTQKDVEAALGMKVATTHEVIEKLQEYERENGIGAIVGISTYMLGDRENEYCFKIANDSENNKIFTQDGKYKITKIDISSVRDNTLFPDRFKIVRKKR